VVPRCASLRGVLEDELGDVVALLGQFDEQSAGAVYLVLE
jgi:hypothetical protein